MKKIMLSILSVFMLSGAVAQEQYLHLYSNGSIDKSYKISSIDSMLYDETPTGSYIDLYRKGVKHRAGDLSEIEKMSVSAAVMPSGVYMGIIGFNQSLYTKEIGSLSTTTKSNFTNFVSNLTSSNGTLLYYAVDNAIDALKVADLPNDLVNVSIITFTDGLDQGSIMMNSDYTTNDAYLSAINSRIKTEEIKGLNITAYSIGLRGNDVTDVTQFQKNLQSLASDSDNAIEVSDILEVNSKFEEIANDVYNESFSHTVGLTIPGQSDGTRVRFTFDNVSNASYSTMYIEGTFRLSDRSLTDVIYVGLSCPSGTTIKGVQDGIYVTFTFDEVKSLTTRTISTSYIDQWSYITDSSKWQINSEFTPENNTTMTVSRKSAVIMLVLDCSSSLGSQFSTVKTQANNFITKLAGYGNDETFNAIDLDNIGVNIFDKLQYTDMVAVDGGTFWMGAQSINSSSTNYDSDADSDESPVHEVTLDDFYIGKYEVTQQLWEYVMTYSGVASDGTAMSSYSSDPWLGSNPSSSYGVGNYYPAYYVSYNDIVNIFIPRLNKITGKTFRLPTEAEWEYAARGGNKSRGYKYSGSNTIGDVAWYWDNSSSTTHPVGTKRANELGLYDMSGNVCEWCSDWYSSSYYSSSPSTNPTGPSTGSSRVDRGGTWVLSADYCRVSDRGINHPDSRFYYIGFRLAISLK